MKVFSWYICFIKGWIINEEHVTEWKCSAGTYVLSKDGSSMTNMWRNESVQLVHMFYQRMDHQWRTCDGMKVFSWYICFIKGWIINDEHVTEWKCSAGTYVLSKDGSSMTNMWRNESVQLVHMFYQRMDQRMDHQWRTCDGMKVFSWYICFIKGWIINDEHVTEWKCSAGTYALSKDGSSMTNMWRMKVFSWYICFIKGWLWIINDEHTLCTSTLNLSVNIKTLQKEIYYNHLRNEFA